MKKITLMIIAVLSYSVMSAQIFPGFLNDFEDGTTQGWSNGGSSPNPPTNIPDGGPGGAGDAFLEERDLGGGGWSTAYASTKISEDPDFELCSKDDLNKHLRKFFVCIRKKGRF